MNGLGHRQFLDDFRLNGFDKEDGGALTAFKG
ncbi:hypothetical protein WL1483_3146 [Aeromonas schubertii]|uniref:Uncharacterized protein n=1 Tax=Aeromonas schubertii TaxID=652 RepID=A0A0S2SLF0_9GAMM|nr:hypothetical protein WL1483_3146 [Aeromonas schubertii]